VVVGFWARTPGLGVGLWITYGYRSGRLGSGGSRCVYSRWLGVSLGLRSGGSVRGERRPWIMRVIVVSFCLAAF